MATLPWALTGSEVDPCCCDPDCISPPGPIQDIYTVHYIQYDWDHDPVDLERISPCEWYAYVEEYDWRGNYHTFTYRLYYAWGFGGWWGYVEHSPDPGLSTFWKAGVDPVGIYNTVPGSSDGETFEVLP